MSGVWYRARVDLRRTVGATVLLIVLVGLAGGVVFAAVAGSIRGRDALPSFVTYSRPATATVFIDPQLDRARIDRLKRHVTALPQWQTVAGFEQPVLTMAPRGRLMAPTGFVAYQITSGTVLADFDRSIVLEGHLPDPAEADAVVVNEAFAADLGLAVGDSFAARTVTPENIDQVVNRAFAPDPDGMPVRLRVAAVQRQPGDLTYEVLAQEGTVYASRRYHVYLNPGFWDRYGAAMASYNPGAFGRVRPGQVEALRAAMAEVAGDHFFLLPGSQFDAQFASIQRAVDFEANALLLFAAVVALAAALLVGQAIGRQVSADLVGNRELSAMGFDHRQRAVGPLVRASVVAVGGACLAVVLAVALSPLTPIGRSRRAEIDPGLDVNASVLALGAALLVIAVIGGAGVHAWRASRFDPRRPTPSARVRSSWLGRWLNALGAPLSAAAGARMALERGRGRAAVPVAGALAALIAGVAVVAASVVFSASLQHVVATPGLRGWGWDITVGGYSDAASSRAGAEALRGLPGVVGTMGYTTTEARVGGQDVEMAVLGPTRGEARGPTLVEGRLPLRSDEIALAPETLHAARARVGDRVQVQSQQTVDATVTGVIVAPAVLDSSTSLGRGAAMTLEGAQAIEGGATGTEVVPENYLLTFAPGADRDATTSALRGQFPGTVLTPTIPGDIEELRRVRYLPQLLALFLAVLAAGTLANTIVTSVRRRRRDLAVLKAVGFRRRDLAGTIAFQSTTLAVIALVFGLPLGVATGNVVWRLVIESVGIRVDAVLPVLALAAIAFGVFVIANLVAVVPARTAARTPAAAALRAE